METETKTEEVVEEAVQTAAPIQPNLNPLSNIFKAPAKGTSTVVSNICTNCENSGLSCSVCGYNKP